MIDTFHDRLNAAGTGQEDNFYPYEETPVEYFHFSGGMAIRYSVELISKKLFLNPTE